MRYKATSKARLPPAERVPSPLAAALTALELANSDPARAKRAAQQAIGSSLPEPVAVAQRALGIVAAVRGQLGEAEDNLRSAIATAESGGLPARAGEARGTLSYILVLTGRTGEALAELERAAPALNGIPAARLAMQRALVLTEVGRLADAENVFRDAMGLLAAAGGDQLLEGDIRTNRSLLRIRTGAFTGAQADLAAAQELFEATAHPGRLAVVYHNRGLVAAAKGDISAALAFLEEGAGRYREAGRSPGLLPVEKAEVLLSVLMAGEARATAEQAAADYAAEHNDVDLVQAQLLIARAALIEGDTAGARSVARRARRSALAQQRPSWAALAGYLAYRADFAAGRRTAGMLRSGRLAAAALALAGWSAPAQDMRLMIARTALDLRRPALAEDQLAMVRTWRRRGPAELRAHAWHAQALSRLAAGDRRGTLSALRAGLRVLDEFRAGVGATELRVQAAGHAGELAALGLQLAVESGSAAAVLDWTERTRAAALRYRPARPPDIGAVVADLAELRRLAAAASAPGGVDDQASALRRQAALERRIRDRARTAPSALTPRSALTATRGSDGPVGLAELTAALGDRALLEFVEFDANLHAIVVRRDRIRLVSLGPIDPVVRRLDIMRYALRRIVVLGGAEGAMDLLRRQADELDRVLLAPLRDDLGDRAVVVVPTGALHAMPWSILASCAGRPVSVAPAAHVWCRAVTDSRAGARDRGADQRVLVAGPGLPHAGAEVADLATLYPKATLLSGRRATAPELTARMDGAALVHIAAHGRVRSDNPLFGSLEMTDGPWTVYDLETVPVAPRLVVLSACDVGRSAVRAGDEVLGLAAAFLGQGTRTLVAGVMPVPDEQGRAVMLRFHRRLVTGESPAKALAGAQIETVAGGDVQDVAAAASFICLGAG